MRVLTGHPSLWARPSGKSAVIVGVLDGLHLGHRSLLHRLDPSFARTVLTFEPHPVEILRPGSHPRLLSTIEERLELLEGAGVDQVGVLDLSDIKEYEPARFVEEVLVERLAAAQVVCGLDFRFGRDRAGDANLLAVLGKDFGFEVDQARLIADESGGIISSSWIRTLIESGRPAEAAVMLGSTFRITGEVRHGDHRGAEIGVPTANIGLPARKVVPAFGVYAGNVVWGGRRHPSAINIGVRPTFGEGEPLVEAHLLDFEGDLYGERISVELAHYLRPEIAFDNVEDLVSQMGEDIARTRDLVS